MKKLRATDACVLTQRLPGAEGSPERDAQPLHATPPLKKERKKRLPQTRDGGGGQGPHLHEQDTPPLKEKKENREAKGGMGGRHAATTQGF